MHQIIRENIIKNILVVVILAILYPFSRNSLQQLSDPSIIGNLLVVFSIISVTACFGNFAFTYEKISAGKQFSRYFAHFTTGLFMLIIGFSLIAISILVSMLIDKFLLLNAILLILYLSCACYDFWDVYRAVA